MVIEGLLEITPQEGKRRPGQAASRAGHSGQKFDGTGYPDGKKESVKQRDRSRCRQSGKDFIFILMMHEASFCNSCGFSFPVPCSDFSIFLEGV